MKRILVIISFSSLAKPELNRLKSVANTPFNYKITFITDNCSYKNILLSQFVICFIRT